MAKKDVKNGMVKLRIPEPIKWCWNEFAKARGMTMSGMVRAAVSEYLKNHPEEEFDDDRQAA